MTVAPDDRLAKGRFRVVALISRGLRSGISREISGPDVATTSSQEMSLFLLLFYIPGTVLAILAVVLPNPGVDRVPLIAAIVVAILLTIVVWRWGSGFPEQWFAGFVLLATVLICVGGRLGGSGGLAITFLYVFSPIYSFFFYSMTVGIVLLGVVAVEVIVFPPAGGGWVYTAFILGVCTIASIWTKAATDQIRKLARTDSLTGLLNRRAWENALGVSLAIAQRRQDPLCLVMVDIDHFKVFNDEQGHQAGDQLLRESARAWQESIRAGDVLARYGGEEFVFLLYGCTLKTALPVMERLLSLIPRGQTCSAGVAEWKAHEPPEVLLHRADVALFEAKHLGRNRINVAPPSDTDFDSQPGSASLWAKRVAEVLEQQTVDLAFQPVVDFENRGVLGYEALARPMGYEYLGSVQGFFTAAGRMGKLSELDELCRRLALQTTGDIPAGRLLFVNISLNALIDPSCSPEELEALARKTDHLPSEVVLEISERETMTNLDQLQNAVETYRKAGFKFALDDVGDGHSTLEGLATVNPDFVKLAMHFTWNIDQVGPRGAVTAVVAFAESTGAQVIAEGVEDEATAQKVFAAGVRFGQGFHLGKPEPPDVAYRMAQ
jgi:diguanylate cyclase (GGDEF)-like protein